MSASPGWRARMLREPLVHFLVGGALVFAFFAWRGQPVDPASRTIVVSQERRAQLALQWEQTMQRPPTDAELDALVGQWVHEEILYREALRLGLDAGDAVVRRRLAKKMDLIGESEAETAVPGNGELQAWLDAHPDRFARDPRFTFDQLYFARAGDAARALAKLRPGADWRGLGEPISLPRTLDAADGHAVAGQFGPDFLDRLERLRPAKTWQGPVPSGFGYHLVRLSAVTPGKVPPLEAVYGEVLEDWRAAQSASRREKAYAVLRAAYTVKEAR